MKEYIIKRVVVLFILLTAICVFAFSLMHLAPGNPYINSMRPGMTPEQIEVMLKEKGYYDLIYIKFFKWFISVLKFDFGYSMKYGKTVLSLILEKIPNTLFLTVPSLVISLYISIIVGKYIAYHKGFWDKFINILTGIGISMPTFLIAILLIKWLAFDIPVFPISGTGSIQEMSTVKGIFNRIYHGVLPISVLTFIQFSYFVRYIRGYMISVKDAEYIRTYQGFGMTRYKAYKIIGLRNIMPQIFTMIFIEIPNLFSGALITETVFVWPGLGRLNYEAVSYRDYPLIMGIILIVAFTVLTSNFFSDIFNYYLDRRIGI